MSADFLDTNVLVYSFDPGAPAKRDYSRKLIRSALADHTAVISYQVVQEFLNIAMRKFLVPMTATQGERYLDTVLIPLCAVWPSQSLYGSALQIASETGFGFYDSLIITSAIQASCKRLLTEDHHDGQVVRGVEIVNPFR